MRRPRFRADQLPVRLSAPAGDYLVVAGETRHLLVEDPVAAELAGLADGRTETADLVGALADRYPPRRVAASLRRLIRLGLLADGPTAAPADVAAAWDARGVDPDDAARQLTVSLVDAGAPGVAAVESHLLELGMKVTGEVGDGPIVVAVSSPTDPGLAAFNAARLADGRGWTMVRPHGTVLLLGPHFLPGETGCWQCLRQRWTENEPVLSYLDSLLPGPRPDPARASIPATIAIAAGMLAAELPVLAATGRSSRLTGRLVTFDTGTLTGEGHDLVRQPYCAACGEPPAPGGRIVLEPAPVTVSADGGSRSAAAAQTYRRLARHVDRYLGVVTRLEPMEDYHNGLTYSFGAGHNFALPRGPAMLRTNLRGLSGGKGRTEIQAKMSAVGEAVERYCGVWRGERTTIRAAWPDLPGAVPPQDLLLFSDAQYAAREPARSHFHRVPKRLAADQQIAWSPAWSLTHDEPRNLPAAYCWYGHPDLAEADVCGADSNGCAAGETLPEAILQGFCELVERDSVALWWYHRSRMPGVDLASFGDPWIDALGDFYPRRLGRSLWALDLTADVGIPTFAAVSSRTDRPVEDVLVGFGSHPDPAVAVGRALAEVNQFLPMVARSSGDRTRYAVEDPETLAWFTTVRIAEHPWLTPSDAAPTTAATYASTATGDAAEDVRDCVRRAAGAGLDVIVLDQSRPDLELRVARVVVPGLRHFWRRLGPGRLWDVPHRLGRTGLAADETAMNPLSVFF
ncbi:TOMM precursor leader peptide-binding protein [Actinoplanes sp. NPDC049316]|uniref:TOMM precursor leader peptide-binding protein n=1 Tax=Actinoplanes sp. NPDC049316 TaxID=3154727 RepID=UPI003420BF0D